MLEMNIMIMYIQLQGKKSNLKLYIQKLYSAQEKRLPNIMH